jgi:hypothetical protein
MIEMGVNLAAGRISRLLEIICIEEGIYYIQKNISGIMKSVAWWYCRRQTVFNVLKLKMISGPER